MCVYYFQFYYTQEFHACRTQRAHAASHRSVINRSFFTISTLLSSVKLLEIEMRVRVYIVYKVIYGISNSDASEN